MMCPLVVLKGLNRPLKLGFLKISCRRCNAGRNSFSFFLIYIICIYNVLCPENLYIYIGNVFLKKIDFIK